MNKLNLLPDDSTTEHLRKWYKREFPCEHEEASDAALSYLNSLVEEEFEYALEKGWPALAVSLNHYQLYT